MKISVLLLMLFALLSLTVFPQVSWNPLNQPEGGKINVLFEKDGYYFASIGGYFGALYRSDDDGNTWTLKIDGLSISSQVNDIAENDQYIFVAIKYGGISRSSDYGETWELCSSGLPPNQATISLCNSGDTLYTGTQLYGVYKSTDNGDSWTSLNNQFPEEFVYNIAVAGNYVFAGTNDGIYRSLNGGPWQEADNGITPLFTLYIRDLVYNNGYMFAGLYDDVYRSTDFGSNWQAVTNGAGGAFSFYAADNNLYKTCSSGVYYTSDNGTTWTSAENSVFNGDNLLDIVIYNGTMLTGDNYVYRSVDNGSSWTNTTSGIANQTDYGLIKNNGYWFTSNSDGILRSVDNGVTWDTIYTFASTNNVVEFFPYNNYLFASIYSGSAVRSGDNGESWDTMPFNFSEFAGMDNYLFATQKNTTSGLIYRSSDGGNSWQTLYIPLAYGTESVRVFNGKLYIGGEEGLFVSSDLGENWSPVDYGYTVSPAVRNIFIFDNFILVNAYLDDGMHRSSNGSDWEFYPNPLLNQTLFDFAGYGTNMFVSSYYGGILKSEDYGITWQPVNDGLPYLPSVDYYPKIYDMEIADNVLYATIGQYSIWQADLSSLPVELSLFTANINNGYVIINWKTASEKNNKGFEVERSHESVLPAGETGIKSQNKWTKIGYIEGNGTTTESHSYSFTDKRVQQGKYQYRLKQIDFDGSYEYSKIIEVELFPPGEFSLAQNYPNPFNPTTTIRFSIPGKLRVTLKVYDFLGREITTLVNEEKSAGRYAYKFDGNKLSSGLYFYTLKAGSRILTKKMLLVK